ncbi:MAG: hypothetical protein K5695_15195 [Oscillospiraceae bacterium]|nr:hypothetical protein [Oscillospiraceae bacterium]
MMLYRSLIYREIKLTNKRFLIMLVLFLLTALLLVIPLLLGSMVDPAAVDEETFDVVLLLTLILAATGGVLAGTNNGILKADIASGWKRYTKVLPAKPLQSATADVLVKLLWIGMFGLLSVGFAALCLHLTGCNTISHTVNSYLLITAATLLIDVVYTAIVSLAKTGKDLTKFILIATGGTFAVFAILSRAGGFAFGGWMDNMPQTVDNGEMLTPEQQEQLMQMMNFLGSGTMTLIAAGSLAVVCAAFFLVLWKAYERREA